MTERKFTQSRYGFGRGFCVLFAGAVLLCTAAVATAEEKKAIVVESYADIAWQNYTDAYTSALLLQDAVRDLLADPNPGTLAAARQAWIFARNPYGQSEVFRFYEGPIDFVDLESGIEGPEGRLNAWPVDEAYIDYVKGRPNSGIINDADGAMSKESLLAKNQANDESDVSLGYHAIEFLLWGQDFSLESAGSRPASDYYPGEEIRERRREYLRLVTEILVEDLAFLVREWDPAVPGNYARQFRRLPSDEALARIMTGMATLSGFELASERLAVPLDSGDQEDEHSCFSDNTHNDFLMNALAVHNVYFGIYGEYRGAGIHSLLVDKDPALDGRIVAAIERSLELIAELPSPIDREILSTPLGSASREKAEAVVLQLQNLADLLKEAGSVLGVEVAIVM